MKPAGWAWVICIAGALVYEAYAVANSIPHDTLSEFVWENWQHPMISFAVGVLVGHFWWQGSGKHDDCVPRRSGVLPK